MLLMAQLGMLGSNCKKKEIASIHDIRQCLQQFTSAEQTLLNKVVIVMKLLLVLPATNASNEKLFSALKWIKTHSILTPSLCSRYTHVTVHHACASHMHSSTDEAVFFASY